MKFDRSRSLWPTLAMAGAAALLSLYGASAHHAFAFEACAHCAATPGAIEVKDQNDVASNPRVADATRGTHPHDPLATPDGAICRPARRPICSGGSIPPPGRCENFL